MRSVRVTTILDDSGAVTIPVPAELHAGERVELEVFFHNRPERSAKSWAELLDSVEGIFEGCPLELPDYPPPEPFDPKRWRIVAAGQNESLARRGECSIYENWD